MDDTEVKAKIQNALDIFGMSGKKAAEVMGISYDVYRKKNTGAKGHYFHEQHYTELVRYIKEKANELE